MLGCHRDVLHCMHNSPVWAIKARVSKRCKVPPKGAWGVVEGLSSCRLCWLMERRCHALRSLHVGVPLRCACLHAQLTCLGSQGKGFLEV
jgi:hypothetical protein